VNIEEIRGKGENEFFVLRHEMAMNLPGEILVFS